MTFFALLQRLFGLLSLFILGLGVYLVWTGYQRDDEGDPGLDPALAGEGDETRLWIGWGLLALSFLGRWIWPLILAKPTPKDDVAITRGEGRTVAGADGSELRVESFGPADAPVIVLTHGWGLESTVWRYARRDLGDRFRLLVWDMPGMGKSTPPQGRVTLERFAEDLRAVIGQAGGKPVVVVGHSIGGMTAQTLAGLHPELLGEQVKGIVLVNTTHLRPIKTTFASGLVQALWPILAALLHLQIWLRPVFQLMNLQSYQSGQAHIAARIGGFGKHVNRRQLDHVTWLTSKNNAAVQAKGDFAMMEWDVTPKLPAVRVPVLVLAGDKDLITRPDASDTIAKLIPGARLKTMPGCGHMGFYELPQAYNREIAAFAEEVLGAPAATAPPQTATIRTA